MVKTVIGEETRLKLAEDRLAQSGLPSEVGLVIGKLSSSLDRGYVFDLVPTPPNDAGESVSCVIEPPKDDKKKGSKSKAKSQSVDADSSSLSVDKEWVAEHARQVSRMLLGGMKVIGIYVWVSDVTFKNSTIMLGQVVKGVAEAAPLLESGSDERLLIHICYSPRRWTCRNCSLNSNITSSNLRTCDFKMGKVLTSLQTYKCMYNFDIRLPIFHESASNARILSDVLRRGISTHTKELKGAKALIDGKLVVNDESCTGDSLHEVELLLPFMRDISAEACSQKDVLGVLVFSGSVCSFAYLNPKEPTSQAVLDIKEDIIMSLKSRLEMICEETDGDINPADDGDKETGNELSTGKPVSQLDLPLLRKTCCLTFPRRVFVPWLAGTLICDYLQPSETLEVLKEHCVELMSMEAPTDSLSILEPEIEASSHITKSFRDIAVPFSSAASSSLKDSGINTTREESSTKSLKSANLNIIAPVFILLLSILVGYFLYHYKTL